jgi:hypothetical protein
VSPGAAKTGKKQGKTAKTEPHPGKNTALPTAQAALDKKKLRGSVEKARFSAPC